MTDLRLDEAVMMDQRAARRRPLPASRARPAKRDGGGDTCRPTAHVRLLGVDLPDDDRGYIQKKLGMKLGKFAAAIERVSVRLADTNGPRGGTDQLCTVKVVLSGLPSVVIVRRDAAVRVALDLALRAVERAVYRSVSRRRMKPLRDRASRQPMGLFLALEG
jgi:hypothetical protein